MFFFAGENGEEEDDDDEEDYGTIVSNPVFGEDVSRQGWETCRSSLRTMIE